MSDREHQIELTQRQLWGLERALRNLDLDLEAYPRGVTLTIAGSRIILDSPQTGQRWDIGPKYRRVR